MGRNAEEFVMTEPGFEKVPPARIIPCEDFQLRYEGSDPRLTERMRHFRYVTPLFTVRETDGRFKLISGFRRFRAAVSLGLPALPVNYVAAGQLDGKELFRLALLLNETATYTVLDQAILVKKAVDSFGFSWEDLAALADLHGLPPSPKVIEEYYRIGRLPDEFHRALQTGQLPFKGARALLRFQPDDQILLLDRVFSRAQFSASEAEEILESLGDLVRGTGVALAALLEREEFRRSAGPGPAGKEDARQFLRHVRELRSPLLAAWEKKFQEIAERIAAQPDVVVEKPQGFEAEALQVRLKVSSPERLKTLIDHLSRNEFLFKDLFHLVE